MDVIAELRKAIKAYVALKPQKVELTEAEKEKRKAERKQAGEKAAKAYPKRGRWQELVPDWEAITDEQEAVALVHGATSLLANAKEILTGIRDRRLAENKANGKVTRIGKLSEAETLALMEAKENVRFLLAFTKQMKMDIGDVVNEIPEVFLKERVRRSKEQILSDAKAKQAKGEELDASEAKALNAETSSGEASNK